MGTFREEDVWIGVPSGEFPGGELLKEGRLISVFDARDGGDVYVAKHRVHPSPLTIYSRNAIGGRKLRLVESAVMRKKGEIREVKKVRIVRGRGRPLRHLRLQS